LVCFISFGDDGDDVIGVGVGGCGVSDCGRGVDDGSLVGFDDGRVDGGSFIGVVGAGFNVGRCGDVRIVISGVVVIFLVVI